MSEIKLLNGDCYELIKQIPDNSIDLVYIDIPYLFDKHGGGTSNLAQRIIKNQYELGNSYLKKDYAKKIKEYEEKMLNAETKSEYEKWRVAKNNIVNMVNLKQANIVDGIDYSIFDELCRVMKNIYIYIWCSKEQILDIMKYFIDNKGCRFNILTWNKTNPTPATNGTYLPDIEYCLVFKENGSPKYNDGYELKSKWYVSPINKSDKDLFNHPTIKPLELVKRHILHSSNEGDTILDCFMGSGTTGVACKETNRNFIGIEIDKDYFKIAQNRINGINANGQISIFTDIEQISMEE